METCEHNMEKCNVNLCYTYFIIVDLKGFGEEMSAESYFVITNPFQDKSDLQILFSGYSQTKPNHQIGPRVFDYYLLHHVHSGHGKFTCADKEYSLGKGNSFVIEPGKLVTYSSDELKPWFYSWIAFKGEKAREMLSEAGISSKEPVVQTGNSKRVPVLLKQMQNTLKLQASNSNLQLAGYFYLLLAEFQKHRLPARIYKPEAASETEMKVQQAIHYLTTQYSEPITIERMAQSLGYSREYLSKLFKAYTKTTPITFLSNLRLNNARLLLRERMELTVEQVASSVGFNDPLYFSKQFKKMYGQSPSEYKKLIGWMSKN